MTRVRLFDTTEPQIVTAVCVLTLVAVALLALGRHLSRTTPTP